MKINVKYVPSSAVKNLTLTPSDLGLSDQEWMAKSDDEKRVLLMDAGEAEQPYWDIEHFDEEKEEEQ